MKTLGVLFISALLSCGYVSAQEVSRFTGDIGGGFTQPVGTTGSNLNEGWNIQGGLGVNFSPYIGAKIDLGYNRFNLSSFALNSVGVPGGDVQIFSATLDPDRSSGIRAATSMFTWWAAVANIIGIRSLLNPP